MLTNQAVKAARPRAAAYKMFDERGLFLFVAPSGLRAWRMKYRFKKREKLLSIGHYPVLDLGEARARAEEARMLLERGLDPSSERQSSSSADHFETIARAWFEARKDRWSAVHAGDVITSLERDIFPALGNKPITSIEPTDVLELIQSMEDRGVHETARRVRQRIDGVFQYAIVRKLCSSNPAAAISAELRPAPIGVQHHAALLNLDDVRALLAAAELVEVAPIVKQASRFLALTGVRIGTLRLMSWREVEDLDGPAPLWRIPASHMKLTKAKKADRANDHLVPLAPAAADILRQIRKNGCDAHSFVFPIAGGAISDLYKRAGFGGRHVPHGWRASFSTILNDQRPEDSALIDMALAHAGKRDKVEAAYNRSEQLARRRDLFCRWAEILQI